MAGVNNKKDIVNSNVFSLHTIYVPWGSSSVSLSNETNWILGMYFSMIEKMNSSFEMVRFDIVPVKLYQDTCHDVW
jgi:hypothetical protein